MSNNQNNWAFPIAYFIQSLKYNTNNSTYLKQQVAQSKTHIFSALLIILWYVWRGFQLRSGAQKLSFHTVRAIVGGLCLSARFGQVTVYKGLRIGQFSVIHTDYLMYNKCECKNLLFQTRQILPRLLSDLLEALMGE